MPPMLFNQRVTYMRRGCQISLRVPNCRCLSVFFPFSGKEGGKKNQMPTSVASFRAGSRDWLAHLVNFGSRRFVLACPERKPGSPRAMYSSKERGDGTGHRVTWSPGLGRRDGGGQARTGMWVCLFWVAPVLAWCQKGNQLESHQNSESLILKHSCVGGSGWLLPEAFLDTLFHCKLVLLRCLGWQVSLQRDPRAVLLLDPQAFVSV